MFFCFRCSFQPLLLRYGKNSYAEKPKMIFERARHKRCSICRGLQNEHYNGLLNLSVRSHHCSFSEGLFAKNWRFCLPAGRICTMDLVKSKEGIPVLLWVLCNKNRIAADSWSNESNRISSKNDFFGFVIGMLLSLRIAILFRGNQAATRKLTVQVVAEERKWDGKVFPWNR